MSAVPRLLDIKRARYQLESKTGDSFEVSGPQQLGLVINASRLGLGWTVAEAARRAKVCPGTWTRAEKDKNQVGSWGWFRTKVQILSALGLAVRVVKK